MTAERSLESQAFFDEVKHFIMDVLPNTLLGYTLLFIINVGFLKINSVEFMAEVAKTGVYVFCLVMARYLAIASLALVNHGLSRIASEKRTEVDQ